MAICGLAHGIVLKNQTHRFGRRKRKGKGKGWGRGGGVKEHGQLDRRDSSYLASE